MRDFRDAKAMAQTVRAALAAKGLKITISESLELIAKAFGAPDWNTLSAAIKAAETEPVPSQAPSSTPPVEARQMREPPAAPRQSAGRVSSAPRWRRRFTGPSDSPRRASMSTTLEHLLHALIDDLDAGHVMRACEVDLDKLRKILSAYVDNQPRNPVAGGDDPAPTAGFHRVIQRAVVHVGNAGLGNVTGANVLVAIFSERDSQAAAFLQQQKLSRFDAVNFFAHGIRKDGGRAA